MRVDNLEQLKHTSTIIAIQEFFQNFCISFERQLWGSRLVGSFKVKISFRYRDGNFNYTFLNDSKLSEEQRLELEVVLKRFLDDTTFLNFPLRNTDFALELSPGFKIILKSQSCTKELLSLANQMISKIDLRKLNLGTTMFRVTFLRAPNSCFCVPVYSDSTVKRDIEKACLIIKEVVGNLFDAFERICAADSLELCIGATENQLVPVIPDIKLVELERSNYKTSIDLLYWYKRQVEIEPEKMLYLFDYRLALSWFSNSEDILSLAEACIDQCFENVGELSTQQCYGLAKAMGYFCNKFNTSKYESKILQLMKFVVENDKETAESSIFDLALYYKSFGKNDLAYDQLASERFRPFLRPGVRYGIYLSMILEMGRKCGKKEEAIALVQEVADGLTEERFQNYRESTNRIIEAAKMIDDA